MDEVFNRVLRRRRRNQRGFTLIELLVVIAVLAILAAIVLFNVVGVANRGKASSCLTDKQTIQTAVDGYFNDTITTANPGVYPVASGSNTGPAADAQVPSAGAFVSYTELQNPPSAPDRLGYIHSAPPETFTYTGASGTIQGPC